MNARMLALILIPLALVALVPPVDAAPRGQLVVASPFSHMANRSR